MMVAFIVGLIVAGLSSQPILILLRKLKSEQTINAHVQEHAHKQGTPTMGGLMILVAIVAAAVMGWSDRVISPLLVTLGFGVIGFVDDYVVPKMMPGTRGLGWKQKLALEFLICGGACWLAGFHEPKSIAIAIFMILFYSNAYNFSDGIDGLAATIGIFLTLGMMIVTHDQGPLMPGLMAGFFVFLYYNRHPAKVFMGDVGALPIGALLGWYAFLLVQSPPVAPTAGYWVGGVLLSLVMLIEIIPPPLQVFYYKLTKKRIFPKTPIHHSFQIAGWPENRIVALFAGLQMLGTIGAIALMGGAK